MLLNLFGKKKAPEQKINQPSDHDVELERQRMLANMQKTLDEMRQQIEAYYQRVDQTRAQAKNLIRENQENEAKEQLRVLKAIQEDLDKQENRCIILEKAKIQLEVVEISCFRWQFFKTDAEKAAEAEKNRKYLEDLLIDKKEMDDQNKEIAELLSDLATDTEEEKEEIDAMYKELKQEVLDEQMDNINNPSKSTTQPQV